MENSHATGAPYPPSGASQSSAGGLLCVGKVHQPRYGLKYSVNQEAYLKFFLENGTAPIDNSASERAIRPFCVGRSNWRVMDSVKVVQASAVVYSYGVVETAKANRLKPYKYLRHLFTELPKHMDETDASFLDNLLPCSDAIPDIYRKPVIQDTLGN
ncbi:MAG: transposase domain-containing protein [Oscillospiraceae bacterium]|nr:transposase domain-containing protein [Oscillospiraceae bacterium]